MKLLSWSVLSTLTGRGSPGTLDILVPGYSRFQRKESALWIGSGLKLATHAIPSILLVGYISDIFSYILNQLEVSYAKDQKEQGEIVSMLLPLTIDTTGNSVSAGQLLCGGYFLTKSFQLMCSCNVGPCFARTCPFESFQILFSRRPAVLCIVVI